MSGREQSSASLSFEAVPALRSGVVFDRSNLRAEEAEVISYIDGQRSVAELMQLTGMSGYVLIRLLRGLYERHIIVPAGRPDAFGRAPAPVSTPRFGTAQYRTIERPAPEAVTTTSPSTELTVQAPRALSPRQPVAPLTPASGQPTSTAQEIWFSATKRDWFTLAVVPAAAGRSALPVGHALVQAGSFYRGKPVELLSALGVDLKATNPADWVRAPQIRAAPAQAPGPNGRRRPQDQFDRVIVLESVVSNPLGLPIAHGADSVLVVVETVVTTLDDLRWTVEAIGRDHLMGCVLVPSSRER
jgi:hypothetical protein